MRTSNFSLADFGNRERYMAGELLIAWSNGAWASAADHIEDEVALECNPSSGYVFLADEDGNTVMLNADGKLENWLYCSDCRAEGFRSEVPFSEDRVCSQCAAKEA